MLYWLTHPHFWLLTVALNAVAVLAMGRFVPDFQLGGEGAFQWKRALKPALLTAGLYGVLKLLLSGALGLLAAPLVWITLGLFYLVINAFFLWVTDYVLKDVAVNSLRALGIATLVLSGLDLLWKFIF